MPFSNKNDFIWCRVFYDTSRRFKCNLIAFVTKLINAPKVISFLPTLPIPMIFDLIPLVNFTTPPSLGLKFLNQDLFPVMCLEQPVYRYHFISFWWCDVRHTCIKNNLHLRYLHLFGSSLISTLLGFFTFCFLTFLWEKHFSEMWHFLNKQIQIGTLLWELLDDFSFSYFSYPSLDFSKNGLWIPASNQHS